MRQLSASDLLEVWERGAGGTPVEKALVLLAAAYPEASGEALSQLTVAQRDAALFHLRRQTFGSSLKGLAGCPACGERLETSFDADDLRALGLLPEDESLQPGSPPAPLLSFRTAGFQVHYRLPTSADLMRVTSMADEEQARRALLEACLIPVTRQGREVPAGELPPRVVQAIVKRIEQSAGLADLTIPVVCPACGHEWQILFDIVSYFWSEIGAWAVRMLHEVHTLASAYGWREADILAMSAWRRQRYLELLGI